MKSLSRKAVPRVEEASKLSGLGPATIDEAIKLARMHSRRVSRAADDLKKHIDALQASASSNTSQP